MNNEQQIINDEVVEEMLKDTPVSDVILNDEVIEEMMNEEE